MAQETPWKDDPIVPSGGGPLPSPPKTEKPEKPPVTYRTLTPEEVSAKGLNPRTVYQVSSTGQISAITGGKPAAALRQGDSDKLRSSVNQFADFTSLIDTFEDDYGGNTLTGGLENTAQRYSPVPVGTEGQADWWASLARIDNLIRNDLFGASLTAGEKAAYAKTTVTPGMNAEQIRLNLKTRETIMRGALSRYVNGLKAGGWNEQEIDALLGDVAQRVFPEQARRDGDAAGGAAPPAAASTAPGGGGGDLTPPAFGAPAIPNKGFMVNAGGQIAGNTHAGGDDGAQGIARGRTRREDNPLLAGVREEYTRRLARGDDAEALIAWAKEAGISPTAFPSIAAQAAFRREHPEIAIGEYDTSEMDDRFVEIDPLSRGIIGMSDTGPGPFAISAGDAFTGFNLDSLVGATGGNAEQARLGMGEIAERHPVASTAGTIGGGVAAALGMEAPISGIIARNVPRALAADTLYGAVAGAGATDYGPGSQPATAIDRLLGAGKGAVAGLAGSYIGSKTGGMLQRTARGVTDPSVAALQTEGIPMTVGQTLSRSGKTGEVIKGLEDRIAGLPVVGDMVNARRAEGLRKFNSRAFNKALEPIGGTVGDIVGEEAVQSAQDQVSAAFRDALSGRGAMPDQQFADELAEAVGKVRTVKRLGEEVTDQIGEILQPYADEALLSGEALDDISRNLRALRNAYAGDPLAIPVARRVDGVERAIFDLFDRQAQGTIPAYKAARQAYRRLSVIEDSVLKGKNTEGVFTPAQLGMADRTNAVRFGGKRSAARGGGVFHDLQRSAQNVLPSKVPDSGTAGRVLIPLALVGGGAGVDAAGDGGVGTGLTMGTILAALYSRTGQRILTKPGRGMKPGTKRRAVLESDKTRRAIGASAGASAAALTTQK